MTGATLGKEEGKMARFTDANNWALVVLGVLAGVGLLAVTAAVISAATCWD